MIPSDLPWAWGIVTTGNATSDVTLESILQAHQEGMRIRQDAEAAEAALLAGRYCETCGRVFERVRLHHWKVCRCVWERIKAAVPYAEIPPGAMVPLDTLYGIQFEVVD